MEQNISEKKPAIAQTADFDVMGALDWKDGIATLPGSNIQVRKKGGRVNRGPNSYQMFFCQGREKIM